MSAFLGEGDCNRAADPAVAASNDRHLVLQFATPTMRFVLSVWPWLHLVFAARLALLVLRRLKLLLFWHANLRAPEVTLASQRRRFRVRAALFAAAERDRAERCPATRFACLDNACFDAERRLSRLSACLVARERFREGLSRVPARPFARSRFAWRFVR